MPLDLVNHGAGQGVRDGWASTATLQPFPGSYFCADPKATSSPDPQALVRSRNGDGRRASSRSPSGHRRSRRAARGGRVCGSGAASRSCTRATPPPATAFSFRPAHPGSSPALRTTRTCSRARPARRSRVQRRIPCTSRPRHPQLRPRAADPAGRAPGAGVPDGRGSRGARDRRARPDPHCLGTSAPAKPAARWRVPRTTAKPGVIIEIRGRVDALVGKIVDHREQALVEDGGRDQRRAPAARGDGRRAGGGRDRVAARGHRGLEERPRLPVPAGVTRRPPPHRACTPAREERFCRGPSYLLDCCSARRAGDEFAAQLGHRRVAVRHRGQGQPHLGFRQRERPAALASAGPGGPCLSRRASS